MMNFSSARLVFSAACRTRVSFLQRFTSSPSPFLLQTRFSSNGGHTAHHYKPTHADYFHYTPQLNVQPPKTYRKLLEILPEREKNPPQFIKDYKLDEWYLYTDDDPNFQYNGLIPEDWDIDPENCPYNISDPSPKGWTDAQASLFLCGALLGTTGFFYLLAHLIYTEPPFDLQDALPIQDEHP